MLQKQKGSLDNYCIEGRRRKPLSKRDRESTLSNGVPVWGSHGLSTYETGIILAKGPARKKDTHTRSKLGAEHGCMTAEGRDRGSQHRSGAAVGPAMIRGEEHLNL